MKNSFSYICAQLWNRLPTIVKLASDVANFSCKLRTVYLCLYYIQAYQYSIQISTVYIHNWIFSVNSVDINVWLGILCVHPFCVHVFFFLNQFKTADILGEMLWL